ncbi:MarR family winged helix-turn-helix transcriptional regulator [Gordonia sp. SL306]|uniref:MarR family winged helix-turn-helix transcriptional regulator n=1 Tax=Gordonia sp. SL306 TaxID=2995145 RepID=UPI002271D6F4|nr:MarR family transcriptional regulator [Gordonia sp. SL306]WAC54551.1 MarR family transcriptional regulator [Gordonia sp. SL306]
MTRHQPTLLYMVKQVELAIRAHLDDVLKPQGLTTSQYTAMTVLERDPGMTAAHLARNSFVTAQSMSDVVAPLLDRGLIERHRDPADRRRLVLSLTADGMALLDTCRGPVTAVQTRMVHGMDAKAAAEFGDVLQSCRKNLVD